jgi:hypothetical protein
LFTLESRLPFTQGKALLHVQKSWAASFSREGCDAPVLLVFKGLQRHFRENGSTPSLDSRRWVASKIITICGS